MYDYSHRDRRAHRDVNRAFWAVVAVASALIVVALVLPLPLVGIAAVLAMGAVGVAYLGWADRLLKGYADDLRSAYESPRANAFTYVEVATPVGLDRDGRGRASRSPHSRRPTPPSRPTDPEPSERANGDSGQA